MVHKGQKGLVRKHCKSGIEKEDVAGLHDNSPNTISCLVDMTRWLHCHAAASLPSAPIQKWVLDIKPPLMKWQWSPTDRRRTPCLAAPRIRPCLVALSHRHSRVPLNWHRDITDCDEAVASVQTRYLGGPAVYKRRRNTRSGREIAMLFLWKQNAFFPILSCSLFCGVVWLLESSLFWTAKSFSVCVGRERDESSLIDNCSLEISLAIFIPGSSCRLRSEWNRYYWAGQSNNVR